jgi:hypothetical protein
MDFNMFSFITLREGNIMKDLNLEENSVLNNKFLSLNEKVEERREKESNEIEQIPVGAFYSEQMKYNIKVKFHEDFVKVDGNKILAGLKSKPEKGEANKELIKKLAEHFNIHSSRVRILSGFKSKNKIVEIL